MSEQPHTPSTAVIEPETGLTVAAVARRIGVAPATLRTWDRRYGIGASEHQEGSHRRYSQADLARLTLMRQLIIAGQSPADAAKAAASLSTDQIAASPRLHQSSASATGEPDASAYVEHLQRARRALDRVCVEAILRELLATRGMSRSWSEVIVPLLKAVGDEWALSGDGIEIEHMLSDLIARVLNDAAGAAPARVMGKPAINATPVLLACVGEEIHSLALNALAACLAEDGIAFQFLGARTPQAAINSTVRKSVPPAIFLWAQLASNADPAIIDALPDMRPAPRVILGGPGWPECEGSRVYRVHDLDSARAEIARALGIF